MCIFSPKSLPHSKNLKNERKWLPPELISEIIKFLPLKLKWSKQRVSLSFDILIFKTQNQWIISIGKILYDLQDLYTLTVTRMDDLHRNLPIIGKTKQNFTDLIYLINSLLGVASELAGYSNALSTSLSKITTAWLKIEREANDELSKQSRASSVIGQMDKLINFLMPLNEDTFLEFNQRHPGQWELVKEKLEMVLSTTKRFL